MASSSHDWTTPDYWDDSLTQSTHAIREVTRRAVRYLSTDGATTDNPRRALDLGAGKGIDALFLLQERFILTQEWELLHTQFSMFVVYGQK